MKIAFVGKMHSGKTTMAKALVMQGFTRMAFADPVKEASGIMLGELEAYLTGQEPYSYSIKEMDEKKGHPSIRALLQLVGTELGREYVGPQTVWIDLFTKRVPPGVPVVNDDCRFVNEAEALRDAEFKIIRLVRNEHERRESIRQALRTQTPDLTADQLQKAFDDMLSHPSEKEQEQIVSDLDLRSTTVDDLTECAKILARDGWDGFFTYANNPRVTSNERIQTRS